MSEDESRLARWSRRKTQVGSSRRRGRAAPVAVAEPPSPPLPGPLSVAEAPPEAKVPAVGEPAAAPRTTAEEEAPPDLPDIDSLTGGSDFTAFLGDKVPGHLHRAAMRKLWLSSPEFAVLDGLNDYDDDYTFFETIGKIVTNYQVGKGMVDPDAEEQADKPAQTAEDAAAPDEQEAAAGDGNADAGEADQQPDDGLSEEPQEAAADGDDDEGDDGQAAKEPREGEEGVSS